jgi:hypothetical protein
MVEEREKGCTQVEDICAVINLARQPQRLFPGHEGRGSCQGRLIPCSKNATGDPEIR